MNHQRALAGSKDARVNVTEMFKTLDQAAQSIKGLPHGVVVNDNIATQLVGNSLNGSVLVETDLVAAEMSLSTSLPLNLSTRQTAPDLVTASVDVNLTCGLTTQDVITSTKAVQLLSDLATITVFNAALEKWSSVDSDDALETGMTVGLLSVLGTLSRNLASIAVAESSTGFDFTTSSRRNGGIRVSRHAIECVTRGGGFFNLAIDLCCANRFACDPSDLTWRFRLTKDYQGT